MIILLHSSKTMKRPKPATEPSVPQLLPQTCELQTYLETLSRADLAKSMQISGELAARTHAVISEWSDEPSHQTLAIDSFVGDIYSGLQAQTLTTADRGYAQKTLRILSGLYGILRPLDGVMPYRLEMGYRLPDEPYENLYKFWGRSIAETLPTHGLILNLSAVEYTKTITPFVNTDRIIAPRFLTVSPKTGEPAFVTVHAKVARGAFARWVIKNRIEQVDELVGFNDIGYRYDKKLSTTSEPAFVAEKFGGIGLSIRLKGNNL
ncbi:MAG TPA: YaaA family protein [Candidatus Saccharimonadales bacterium]|nr:YaaA family protein [Candidatus Saccharimonadales bacterium]